MSSQFFLAAFFGFIFGSRLFSIITFGRPLFPPPLMASKSSFVYKPADPIYLQGPLSIRWSLLFTASDDTPSSFAISATVQRVVFPSMYIYSSLYLSWKPNQGVKGKMSQHLDILLYICIVNLEKFYKISENSTLNLDYPLRRGYSVY